MQFYKLGITAFFELDAAAAAVVPSFGALAGEEGHQFMFTGRHIAEVKPLGAATFERIEFTFSIKVVGDDFVIELDLHGIEVEVVANVERQKNRELGVGRKQQLFFQLEQVAVEFQHLFF